LRAGRGPARPPGATGGIIVYSLQLVDLATDEPHANATVRACGLTDVMCDTPVTPTMMTDSEGWVSLRLTQNFVGFLEIVSERAVPYVFYLPSEGLRRTTSDYPLAMIGLESFQGLLATYQLPLDPTLGGIAFRSFDCQGNPARGVELTSDRSGVPWYFDQGLPNTERRQTDESGLGGFVSSEPGLSILEASLPDGRTIESMSIIVRPSWIAAGYLRPAAALD
jgi:hypothetical protein